MPRTPKPFADAQFTLAGAMVESASDTLSIGETTIERSTEGLKRARKLVDYLQQTIAQLEDDKFHNTLPGKLPHEQPVMKKNPFTA